MNDATYTTTLAYLRSLGDAMLLRDWDLLLSRTPADEGNNASVSLHHGKHQAEVYLGQNWAGRTPEQQRQTLVHELLHCHTARLCRTMTRLQDRVVTDAITGYAAAVFDDEEEVLIDTLARVLAPFLPLPMSVPTA